MDYRDRNQWIIAMNNELVDTPKSSEKTWSKRSIYRIPAYVRDENKKAYEPQLVSIGPYHHGSINLQPMEIHKRRAMLHFVRRSRKPLQSFFDALVPFVEELKDAYDQLDDEGQVNNDAFLELMTVDGCFVLEILRIYAAESYDDDYVRNDPIFSEHGMLYNVPRLRKDMLMLENQLPLLVLVKLVSLHNEEAAKRGEYYLIKLMLFWLPHENDIEKLHIFDDSPHMLSIYKKILLIDDPPSFKNKTESTMNRCRCWRKKDKEDDKTTVRSATHLKEAGIEIKKSKTSSLRDISFKNGILMLPQTQVHDGSESRYLNLLAFERAHVEAGNQVSSYIWFMDDIIDSSKDVNLLRSCHIIQNLLGSDKDVAILFNTLSKNVVLGDDDGPLDEVREQVNAYCQNSCHKWRANLMHNYFTNPWVALSVIAALILFALTTVQTVYTVLGYYKKTP